MDALSCGMEVTRKSLKPEVGLVNEHRHNSQSVARETYRDERGLGCNIGLPDTRRQQGQMPIA